LSDTYLTAKINLITSWAEDIIRSSYYDVKRIDVAWNNAFRKIFDAY